MANIVYIGLGANLNEPAKTLRLALTALNDIPDTQVVAHSKLYSSVPMGPSDQPDYVNAVAQLRTELTPHALFQHTCEIEQQHGRTRNGEHWGPRTLDLDILLYGDQQIKDDDLTIPHYGMKEREFVLYPLLEISPELVLPCGTQLKSLTQNVPLNGMCPIE